MVRIILLILLSGLTTAVKAQHLLNLDSCRALALSNNKQLSVAQIERDVAKNIRLSARTKYLPQISAMGAYVHTDKDVSILSADQQTTLRHLGSMAPGTMSSLFDVMGNRVADALQTDTRNVFAGTVTVTQPVFMGGALVAMNRMATLNEQLADNTTEAKRQTTIYDTDKAYWTVVSLAHKKRLAEGYLTLVKRLDGDVDRMIREGVATRADGLSVKVKVNEAEMTLAQIDDGLALARMLLCQLCGLPLADSITLVEESEGMMQETAYASVYDIATAADNRPEIRAMQNAVDISKQTVRVARAGYMPKVMLTGGYMFSNPNVFDGFQNKFGGMWNVGVVVHVPIWNWGDVTYKVRAAKGISAIANLEMEEAREMIELQANQSAFHLNEAHKRLRMAEQSIARAEENLRSANIGFREGVIPSTTVMEAQTAWMQAQSQKIDAEVNMRLAQTDLQKAVGTLGQ